MIARFKCAPDRVRKFAHSFICFFFSSRRRHTRFDCDWSSDVCSSDLGRELDQQSNGLLSREVRVRVPGGPPFPDRITAVQPPLKRHFWPCVSTWCDSSSDRKSVV